MCSLGCQIIRLVVLVARTGESNNEYKMLTSGNQEGCGRITLRRMFGRIGDACNWLKIMSMAVFCISSVKPADFALRDISYTILCLRVGLSNLIN